ncbi:DNA-binding PadR family transcriptional regulator [Rhodoblastus acidophilus]|nr:PadR family transcriptional regulator [Rhodoblastus acidophilus]MCW2275337.1 DNA-binding PadR family transcriptional regulator [Rhodoblastus acidophilus]
MRMFKNRGFEGFAGQDRGGWMERFGGLHAMRGGGFGNRGGGRGPFGRGGPGGGHGGGRERKRMFEGGELRMVMLLLIEQEPRHGYDIIRELEARTGGAYAPSAGVIYPTLTLLEETGLVAAQASGAKKLYAITDEGQAELDKSRAEAEAALARLEALRKRGEAMDMGPVFRAMTNLKAVLQQKALDAGNKAQLLDVAEIIDEAARKIERL